LKDSIYFTERYFISLSIISRVLFITHWSAVMVCVFIIYELPLCQYAQCLHWWFVIFLLNICWDTLQWYPSCRTSAGVGMQN